MNNKQEVFEYLNSGIDKNGSLKKESGFRNKFPELYQEFLSIDFPEELKELPFKQRLWHFLKDDYSIHTCKICGGKVSFYSDSTLYGYKIYCCSKCIMKDNDIKNKMKQTCLNRYGVEYSSQSKEFKERVKQTNLEKYGVENYSQTKECKEKVKKTNLKKFGVEYYTQTEDYKKKSKQTNIKKYGVDNVFKSEEIKEKIKNTHLEKYGVENYSQTENFKNILNEKHDEIQQKVYITKKKNNTFNTSKIEKQFEKYLINNNIIFDPQHNTEVYPFDCDFYLIDYDLYIEIQGTWTHGKHPFNPSNQEDIKLLEKWKSKCKIINGKKNQYFTAVDVWSIKDPLKRKIAKENNLNYLEIFSYDINLVIDKFKNYINNI